MSNLFAGDIIFGESSGTVPVKYEIERKFLVAQLPQDMDSASLRRSEITQMYLFVDGDREERIRKEDDSYCLTFKEGRGLKRKETEIALRKDDFKALAVHAIGSAIRKTRCAIPYENNTVYVDAYAGRLAGLVVAEVEFGSEAEAHMFIAPSWFGKEVTGNKTYSNSSLALSADGLSEVLRRKLPSQ
ncbi:Uncharacterised protein [uncultured archaeon]|nr:Uncharacterised protein [uncultured archaeon]